MFDRYQREIHYLRLSVTDLCNLRCRYCMPDGVEKLEREAVLTYEEFLRLAALFAQCGIDTVRVTGGEPLVRRGIVELCAMLRAVPGIEELCLTTNGTRLEQLAAPLKAAGVDRLNISLDTLRPERYREITRTGKLENVLRGIEAAERAGFENIKLNCVLLGGMNDDEIGDFVRLTAKKPWQVRFIELMPMGAKTMTFECGMRFLTDYLQGDKYFRIHREGHNLDRCRTQFKLVEDMEQKWYTMNEIVKKYSNN